LSCSSFDIYLNQTAGGGTNYGTAFKIAFEVAERNRQIKITNQTIIFFTDGSDQSDRQLCYKYARSLKFLYNDSINFFARGLGIKEFQQKEGIIY